MKNKTKMNKQEFKKLLKEKEIQFGSLNQYSDFEEVHGCEYAHGQYGTINDSRGKVFELYMA